MVCGSDIMLCIICIIAGFCNIWLIKETSGEPPSILPKSGEPNPPKPPAAPVLGLPARPPSKLLKSGEPNPPRPPVAPVPPRPPVAPVLALPLGLDRVAPCALPAGALKRQTQKATHKYQQQTQPKNTNIQKHKYSKPTIGAPGIWKWISIWSRGSSCRLGTRSWSICCRLTLTRLVRPLIAEKG